MAIISDLFDWDEFNIAHIAGHGVLPHEAEEVITNGPLDLDYEFREGEMRLRQVGETLTGRILVVVSTFRDELTRVVTAYPASGFLRGVYLKELAKYGEANPS